MGAPPTLGELKAQYAVAEVMYVDQMQDFLSKAAPPLIYVYGGENSDSGSKGEPAKFAGSEKFECEPTLLHRALHEARVVKSAAEIEILRFANKIARSSLTPFAASLPPWPPSPPARPPARPILPQSWVSDLRACVA
jgi:hypothetical protein